MSSFLLALSGCGTPGLLVSPWSYSLSEPNLCLSRQLLHILFVFSKKEKLDLMLQSTLLSSWFARGLNQNLPQGSADRWAHSTHFLHQQLVPWKQGKEGSLARQALRADGHPGCSSLYSCRAALHKSPRFPGSSGLQNADLTTWDVS